MDVVVFVILFKCRPEETNYFPTVLTLDTE